MMDIELVRCIKDLEESVTIDNSPGKDWVLEEAKKVVKRFRELHPVPPEGEGPPHGI